MRFATHPEGAASGGGLASRLSDDTAGTECPVDSAGPVPSHSAFLVALGPLVGSLPPFSQFRAGKRSS